jgi:ABC-2 type transport system ATP-binding protein
VTVATRDGVTTLLAAARRIEESEIHVTDLGLRRPSLDEVFLTLTAAAQRSHEDPEDVPMAAVSDNHHFSEKVA